MASPTRPLHRVGILLLFVSLLTSFIASAPNTAVQAEPLPPLGIVIRGHGNGHGRGLSQYGALGWATKLGSSWQDILNFYYGGGGRVLATLTDADATATPGGVMSVRLQTLDARPTAVISDNITASWTGAAGSFGGLVARMVSNNVYDIYGSATATCAPDTDNPTGFTLIGDNVAGPIDFVSAQGSVPTAVSPTDLLGLCEPPSTAYTTGRIRYYRGSIRATVDIVGNRRTVNLLNSESYLRGVVPRESPAGWGDIGSGLGMNALRAQAVAARSYSLSEARYTYAKTCDTEDCQVYGGAGLRNVGSKTASVIEDKRSDLAITDTAGYVMKDSRNTIMRTEFTSSNGGRTAGGQFPVQIDNGDIAADAALQSWSRLLSASAIQKAYPTIGVFTSMSTAHDGLGGDWNGYTTSVIITGTAGTVTRTGGQFRSDFDLNSSWFEAFPVAAADPASPSVGSILFIGDSVGESIATEFASIVTPAYPVMNFQSCAGRGMAGASCLFAVTAPQINTDGVGVVNSFDAPAIAIVELGYNDDPATFDGKVQQMLAALISKAVQRVIFVNMSTRSTKRSYAKSNEALTAAAAKNPGISIFDWNAASSAANQWRWFDNSSLCCFVHLSTTGQAEFALFLRQQLDALRPAGSLPTTAAVAPLMLGLPLAKKDAGAMVTVVQKKLNLTLNLVGKSRLATDGSFGPGTERAVRAFQTASVLPVSGIVDRATWDALGLAGRTDLAVLKVGSRHPAVSSLQQALSKVLKKKITATGVFTTSLANDVKLFQKRVKLPVNGRVGPSTWKVLTAAAALTSP
ncbi:MAG: peptidoglycan-binding protein [Ilumatobacteraceae bacterium]